MFYEHGSDGFAVSNIVSCFLVVQWNLVNTVNNGPKKIVRSNDGFFFCEKCMTVLPGGLKRGRNNEVTILPRWPSGGVPLY